MTKAEFLKLAALEYDKIHSLQGEESFYEYEKQFEKIWLEYGRRVLEQSISTPGIDRRKKKV